MLSLFSVIGAPSTKSFVAIVVKTEDLEPCLVIGTCTFQFSILADLFSLARLLGPEVGYGRLADNMAVIVNTFDPIFLNDLVAVERTTRFE